jgi:hypothetical protein
MAIVRVTRMALKLAFARYRSARTQQARRLIKLSRSAFFSRRTKRVRLLATASLQKPSAALRPKRIHRRCELLTARSVNSRNGDLERPLAGMEQTRLDIGQYPFPAPDIELDR